MFKKISALFKNNEPAPEQLYQQEHQMQWIEGKGWQIEGIDLNEALSARLMYLSNRRVKSFDDLRTLYDAALIINEKIDLEIAHQRFAAHLGNTEENLLEFKRLLKILNDYYRAFLRDRK